MVFENIEYEICWNKPILLSFSCAFCQVYNTHVITMVACWPHFVVNATFKRVLWFCWSQKSHKRIQMQFFSVIVIIFLCSCLCTVFLTSLFTTTYPKLCLCRKFISELEVFWIFTDSTRPYLYHFKSCLTKSGKGTSVHSRISFQSESFSRSPQTLFLFFCISLWMKDFTFAKVCRNIVAILLWLYIQVIVRNSVKGHSDDRQSMKRSTPH